MRKRPLTLFASVFVSAALVCMTAAAGVQQVYGITPIVTSNGLGLSLPSINDSGTVAFIDTTTGRAGLYTGNGGPLSTVVSSPTEFRLYFSGGPGAPTINNAGSIAFWAYIGPTGITQGNETAILSDAAGQLSTIVSNVPPVGISNAYSYTTTPQISGNGTVTFEVDHTGVGGGGGVFSGNGGPLTTLISNSASNGPTADPAISHNSVEAYDWPTLNSGNSRTGNDQLFLVNANTTTTLGTISGDFFSHIAVNDAGSAIASTLDNRIYLAAGGSLNPIVNTNAVFSEDGTVSINDSGDIAFIAALSAGGSGIFTGPDPVLDKVVETGDPLDGSTVLQLGFSSEGLNSSGQIAFWAELANGEQGEFVASVPEPASLALLATVAACTMGRRCKRPICISRPSRS